MSPAIRADGRTGTREYPRTEIRKFKFKFSIFEINLLNRKIENGNKIKLEKIVPDKLQKIPKSETDRFEFADPVRIITFVTATQNGP